MSGRPPAGGRQRLTLADLDGEVFPEWAGADERTRAYRRGRDGAASGGGGVGGGGPPAPPTPANPSVPLVGDRHQLLTVVALGQCVALLPRSVAEERSRLGDVVVRPVEDVSRAPSTSPGPGARRPGR